MDKDGFFNVYINARLDTWHQRLAVQHELTHISRGDFFREEDLRKIESM
jgi:Zn-dependent peptidase ImmA (M78 family)